MSELAPLAMAEINEIIRLAELKEKLATQCAGRETTTAKSVNYALPICARGKQMELELQQLIRRN